MLLCCLIYKLSNTYEQTWRFFKEKLLATTKRKLSKLSLSHCDSHRWLQRKGILLIQFSLTKIPWIGELCLIIYFTHTLEIKLLKTYTQLSTHFKYISLPLFSEQWWERRRSKLAPGDQKFRSSAHLTKNKESSILICFLWLH